MFVLLLTKSIFECKPMKILVYGINTMCCILLYSIWPFSSDRGVINVKPSVRIFDAENYPMSERTSNETHVHDSIKCKYIIFANGGKCGSTALFMYLETAFKHVVWDLKGKEHCYKSPPEQTCTREKPYIMDGCPSGWKRRMKGFAHVADDTTVVLLVRAQADRLQSLVNDKGSSGTINDPDKYVMSQMSNIENNFTHTLIQTRDFYKNIKIVHHDELLSISSVQHVLQQILPGVKYNKVVRPIHPNKFSQRDPRHRQQPISLNTRWRIEDHFENTNCAFFRLTGVYISGDNCN